MSEEIVSQRELAALAQGFTTIAVTGTNGKTSTTSLVASIVRAAGEIPVRITTLGMWVDDAQLAEDTSLASFARTLRRARELGARTVALEVTSRALASGFAARWPAHVAVFTNLTHDHLERHGTPEAYLAAKAQLFVRLRPQGVAVLNAADAAAALLAEVTPAHARCLWYLGRLGVERAPAVPLAVELSKLASDAAGLRLELADSPLAAALGRRLQLQVCGEFQAENALAAALAAAAAGYEADAIRRGLADLAGVPGRFEICSREPLVIVDYAHTPDALARSLASARALLGPSGRLSCVFGCGGERDASKRAPMGALADRWADVVWLTTDNPRAEEAAAIASMVRAGSSGRAIWHDVADRRAAIVAAVTSARARDVVLVAGRGAETHQDFGGAGRVPMLDAAVVREVVARSGG